MLKCYCACNSEIKTCIINDAWRQTAHTKKKKKKKKQKKKKKKKKKKKYTHKKLNNENTRYKVFDRISPNDVSYPCFEGLY
jgi:hypothetical protein